MDLATVNVLSRIGAKIRNAEIDPTAVAAADVFFIIWHQPDHAELSTKRELSSTPPRSDANRRWGMDRHHHHGIRRPRSVANVVDSIDKVRGKNALLDLHDKEWYRILAASLTG